MEAKNQKDLLTYFALSIIACLLFILAAGNVLADDLAPDTVYYSDIKGLYSVSFYDSDNHCTIGSRSNSGLSGDRASDKILLCGRKQAKPEAWTGCLFSKRRRIRLCDPLRRQRRNRRTRNEYSEHGSGNWYFLGWATSQNATAAGYWPGSRFTPAESVTFYAVWGQPDLLAPDDLMMIDAEAFAGSDFRFAALSAETAEIRQNAFAGCPNLTAVYIPSAAAMINPDAFGDRQNLPKMTLLGPADGVAQTFAETHGFGFIPVE